MESTSNRQNLPGGTLYVVAVPIGNDADLSERARGILTNVHTIMAEDTRVLRARLKRCGIPEKQVIRSDAHQENTGAALDGLGRGEAWALVSDAGTPGLADPGAEVVRVVREAGFQVVAVPGPCAFVALASISGLQWRELSFVGFLPRKTNEKLEWLTRATADVVAFYESPERIEKTLEDLVECGDRWQTLVLGKELTKTYEGVWVGTPGDVLGVLRNLQDETVWRGEWCGLLHKHPQPVVAHGVGWENVLKALVDEGVVVSRAVDRVRQCFGEEKIPSKRLIYDAALKMSQKK